MYPPCSWELQAGFCRNFLRICLNLKRICNFEIHLHVPSLKSRCVPSTSVIAIGCVLAIGLWLLPAPWWLLLDNIWASLRYVTSFWLCAYPNIWKLENYEILMSVFELNFRGKPKDVKLDVSLYTSYILFINFVKLTFFPWNAQFQLLPKAKLNRKNHVYLICTYVHT